MSKVNVKVGPKAQNCQVEGLPFLPGLCMHRMPSYGKISEFYNVTHNSSGLAIISRIEERNLELIRMILGRMLWDKSAEDIFLNNKYTLFSTYSPLFLLYLLYFQPFFLVQKRLILI